MSVTLSGIDAPGDAELISAVRGGDVDAYGMLFERHAEAARRLARQIVSAGDVEDLVSEAFVKVLTVLQRGGGPDVAFRAYLLTAVRRLRVDRLRAASKVQTTDEIESFDPGIPFRDTVVEGFESEAAAKAFASLPERWQLVLWHTEVEGQKPADVAPLLGMSPNAVSALAYRAREGLRQAFLTQHAADLDDDSCRWSRDHLGGYIRNGLSRRDSTKVEDHLQDCRKCAAIYLELTEVNSNLAGILAPVLLGGAAAAYLSAGSAAAPAGLLAGVDRLRDWIAGNSQAAAVAGVGVVSALVVGTTLAVVSGDEAAPPRADVPGGPASAGSTTPGDDPASAPGRDGGRDERVERPRQRTRTAPPPATDDVVPATTTTTTTTTAAPPAAPTDEPTDDPAPPPAPGPTQEPTAGPVDEPGDGPGDGPTEEPLPTDEPTEEPPDEPGPAPTADLSLIVTQEDTPAGARVTVTASGLPPGTSATLSVTSDDITITAAHLDPRCDLVSAGGGATCTATAEDPSPFAFQVVGQPGTVVTFVLSSDEVVDPEPGNNAVEVTLRPYTGAPTQG